MEVATHQQGVAAVDADHRHHCRVVLVAAVVADAVAVAVDYPSITGRFVVAVNAAVAVREAVVPHQDHRLAMTGHLEVAAVAALDHCWTDYWLVLK